MNILTLQPEVNPKRVTVLGHSEGTIIAPIVAIDNSTKVKNIILIVAVDFEHSKIYCTIKAYPRTFRVRYTSIG